MNMIRPDGWAVKLPCLLPDGAWYRFYSVVRYIVFGGQSSTPGVESDANEIYDPVTNSWVTRNNGNPLPIPILAGTGVTHPDVIYFPGGKDGYQYWMAYTPYPSEAEENPSILRSNDGINWTGTGISNPVIPAGTPGAWNDQENPDPDFIFVPC